MSELNVQNQQLEELEPFDSSITVINCSQNSLRELPELPPELRLLNCSNNPINELPPLPVSIQSLDCAFTRIRVLTLPSTLSNLTILHCDWCDLVEIPILPPNITEFSCSNNPMDALSKPLPSGLRTLICSSCYLEQLPELPNSMVHLECNDNNLSELPELPNGLRILLCIGNSLSELPELPNSLLELECDRNELSELPTLPNGIESLNCSFNHIQNVPAIPETLENFDFAHNPLTRESFHMIQETFPFYDFNPDDYPEGSVVPVLVSPVLVSPVHVAPVAEETEGDRIERRNLAIQYEVHDAFDKLKLSKLYPVLDSGSTPVYKPSELIEIIQELVESNTLADVEERGKIISLFQDFKEQISDTLYRCVPDSESQRLIALVLHYVKRQDVEFKNNYIRFLIGDISSAYEYNPEIPDLDTGSCAKGIKERIIMSLQGATVGQTEKYQPLLRAFGNKIPIDVMRQFTSNCMTEEGVKAMIDAASTSAEKARILASCVREKMRNANLFPTSGAEELPDPPEFTEYIATLSYGFEGGTRRKKHNKKKTKRNIKKMKTKRNIKKMKTKRNIKKNENF
jgi:Leucine-rich repeat (LRR) protein